MTGESIVALLGLIGLAINCTTMFMIFPTKRGLRFSIGALIVFTATAYSFTSFAGVLGVELTGLRGLIYLPMIVWLFSGQLYQKVFAFFLQYFLTVLQSTLASAIIRLFVPYGSERFYIAFFLTVLAMFAGYTTLVFKFGKQVFGRLFVDGRRMEWALYAFGAAISYAVLSALRIAGVSGWLSMLLLLFISWSFCILCFAIINTNEKAKQTYEAEFARDIISSGREHYHKMDEMYGKLRMLRHNYKYHLSTVSELLRSGNIDEVRAYLTDAETELSESELTVYCPNTVINALLVSYAERCARLAIKYDVKVTIPDTLSVPNYEMCIILGNLLENAVEACQKQNDSRWVRLLIKPAGAQLVVKVKNSFNGVVAQENGHPVTIKKDGGLGLKSVQAVAAKYEGELVTEWDAKTFTAYVLVGL